MRTIKFRGKRIDNGEWVYGHYVSSNKTTAALIIPEDNDWLQDYEVVNPETVGQFTGLFDSTGAEIYEGDKLLQLKFRYYPDWDGISSDGGYITKYIHEVQYWISHTKIGFRLKSGRFTIMLSQSIINNMNLQIIGNIHDKTLDQ